MRKIAFYALFALATLAVVVTSASGVNAAKTTPHHISGILPGTVTFVELPFSDITDPYYQVGGLSVVSGQLKSLGNSNVFAFHRPIPAESETVTPTIADGRFFIVAANGDRINGSYEGIVIPGTEPTQLHSMVDWVITGGTGRFENATGAIQADAYVTMPDDPWALEWSVTWILDGTVNY